MIVVVVSIAASAWCQTQLKGNTLRGMVNRPQFAYRVRFFLSDFALCFSFADTQRTATGPITYRITSCMSASGNASKRKCIAFAEGGNNEKAALGQLLDNTDL